MASAFVILLHAGYGPSHYDLMLEHGEALATWQLAENPAAMPAGSSLPARRLADHRKAYLTCQGPVSGGRGSVARTAAGTCTLLQADENLWRFRLAGETWAGLFELKRTDTDDQWLLTRVE